MPRPSWVCSRQGAGAPQQAQRQNPWTQAGGAGVTSFCPSPGLLWAVLGSSRLVSAPRQDRGPPLWKACVDRRSLSGVMLMPGQGLPL